MSQLMIGLTIVAIGTSLPEMITSLLSILFTPNYSDFIIGTTMGSNITNILLAFALFLIAAKEFQIKKSEIFNIISLILTTAVFAIFVILGYVNYFAIILVVFYAFYIHYLRDYQKSELENLEKEFIDLPQKHSSIIKSILILILAFLGLFFGAKLIVITIENIGIILKIPTAFLTLTSISIATSLPELMVTITAARKKEYLMGIGNILGTNILNVCLIIGTSGFFGEYTIETQNYIFPLYLLITATILFSYQIYKKKFNKYYGYCFLALYILYMGNFLLNI